MTNNDDTLMVGGNWTYNTLTNMEGKWTAGNIWVLGPTWEVNEKSGAKAVYSSGTQVIHFGYAGGKQTVLWDNYETYINNEDGSLNTERTFNFDGGIDLYMILLQKITGSARGGDLMMNRTIPFTVKVGKWVMVCISQLVTIPNPLRI